MKTPSLITKNLRVVERLVQNNSPAILTAVGVAGVVATAITTSKATTKAEKIWSQERYTRSINRTTTDPEVVLTRTEKTKLSWKVWIPPISVAAVTCGAIIGAQYVNTKRMAALAAGYYALESKHEEYKDKVRELIGDKKVAQVEESTYKDMVRRGKVGGIDVWPGDVPCIDALTGRPFSSNMEALRKAENDINARINHGDQPSVTDLYALLKIPENKLSDAFGWNDENMCEMKFTTVLDDDGVPYLIMDFSVLPVGNFWKIGR